MTLDQYIQRGPADACWEWTGQFSDNGYPVVGWTHTERLARRAVYESVRGPIPPGRSVRARCGSRACVNPAHMRVMPPLPLVIAEQRDRARTAPQKVTVPWLEHWRTLQGLTPRQLAARAGCGSSTVWRVEHGFPCQPGTVERLAAALGIPYNLLVEAA